MEKKLDELLPLCGSFKAAGLTTTKALRAHAEKGFKKNIHTTFVAAEKLERQKAKVAGEKAKDQNESTERGAAAKTYRELEAAYAGLADYYYRELESRMIIITVGDDGLPTEASFTLARESIRWAAPALAHLHPSASRPLD